MIRSADVYVTVEPTLDKESADLFPITFAVRFPTKWHAKAVARALVKGGKPACVIEVRS